ncbi:hypothetical protein SEUCBS139899_006338 [Sporothrix eucalyptigena]|uniref:Carboxylic ester hydrolase n=1 Tax=Sporothrix eucalyptigena TaxID=1812306 RepID=A0ABP0BY86_9PEZI
MPSSLSSFFWVSVLGAAAVTASDSCSGNTSTAAVSLDSVCTTAYVQQSLPVDAIDGVVIDVDSVTVNAVYNATFSGSDFFPDFTNQSYCNVTFSYSHTGRSDTIVLWYWLPAPANFQNRYLSTGGGGYSITSQDNSLPGGIAYGASAGTTDGGFGGFEAQVSDRVLLANGSLSYETVYNFGYKAIHELTVMGKQLTRNFFSMDTNTTLYSYYQACSEGGREGWSQVQRFPDDFDGAIIGAPAMRYSHQQLQHLWAAVVESYYNIYPKPCALSAIQTKVVEFCDPLDGKTDGMISRSDLCMLQLDLEDFLGLNYSCEATAASTNPYNPQPATPAQSGTVTLDDIRIANLTLDGPKALNGERVYVSWQPGAGFGDADTVYDNTTGDWSYALQSYGLIFAEMFIREQNVSTTIPDFADWTPDTLRDMIYRGWQKFEDVLQTTWPDLSAFRNAGGKVLHFHGESDGSVPPASSVRYFESVRSTMYPSLSYNDSLAAVNEFYRFYLVEGAGHCSPGQCNTPFPQTNFPVMIEWVEQGIDPVTLNATVVSSCATDYLANDQLCSWPLRPVYHNNGTEKTCEFPDEAAFNTWIYDLNAFPMYVY